MKIRETKISDFPCLYALWKKAGLKVARVDREKKETKDLIKLNPSTIFMAVNNGKIIGSVIGAFNGRRAWIYHLAVHPKWQGKGYGSLLLKKAEEALKKKGVTKIILGVSISNLKTISFYEKSDYKVMNDTLLMEKDLWNQ